MTGKQTKMLSGICTRIFSELEKMSMRSLRDHYASNVLTSCTWDLCPQGWRLYV